MKKRLYGVAVLLLCAACWVRRGSTMMIEKVTTPQAVRDLFPQKPEKLSAKTDIIINDMLKQLATNIAVPAEKRSFANTIRAFDHMSSALSSWSSTVHAIEMTSPDADMRTAAHAALTTLQAAAIDHLSLNKQLYEACKEYVTGNYVTEKTTLSAEEQYYIDELMKGFERSGLNLPDDQQKALKELYKELAQLEVQFESNINSDDKTLVVTPGELAGVDEIARQAFAQDEKGNYILRMDYPTSAVIMKYCAVEKTREAYWKLFNTRGYPANEPVLQRVIALRDHIAHMLGYESFAAYDVDDTMAHDLKRINSFLEDLVTRSQSKVDHEIETWKNHLPQEIRLTDKGQFKPWDLEYIKNNYKTKFYDIDEKELSKYFPMEETIKALLSIYERFFDVTFKQLPSHGFWHEDVRLVEVQRKDGSLIGYLLLDLHPRSHKYTHACQIDIIPTITTHSGEYYPAVALVIANFPKPTATTPSLLLRNDVITFFHEFGHALHSLFGSTEMADFSGTRVKMDFVEMPSQMLEEWMWDADIIKEVSHHYQTGAQLDDEIIKKLQALKNYDIGDFLRRQLAFGLLSLAYYAPGDHKDIIGIKKDIFARLRPYLMLVDDEHFEAAFGHLMGYGAKYYGYLWSKVYALDLFDTIKKGGLLNPVIGNLFRGQVIGKGGSREPLELLRDFLGREPKTDAFFADLGL